MVAATPDTWFHGVRAGYDPADFLEGRLPEGGKLASPDRLLNGDARAVHG
jgi:hypothetical protein